jgi:hypothetical protein
MDVNFDVVSRLCNINTIVHVKEALSFHGHREFFIEHVEEDISGTRIRCRDSEIIHLSHEDDTNAVDSPRVKAWFVHRRCEAKVTKNRIRMLFPQTRRFGVALHCRHDRDCMSGWDGRSTFVVFPPFMKGSVGAYVEALFWRWCLGEGIADVGTVDEEIFGGSNGIKEARAGLIDTVRIGFVENLD